MYAIKRLLAVNLLLMLSFCNPVSAGGSQQVPVLAYHNFSNTPGSMTISPEQFEKQVIWLKDNGYTVIPLQELVSYLRGERDSLPEKSIVITADDGRNTVYSQMLPIVRRHNIPVTLFIYPTAISNASYAMTWTQLKELHETGLFDIQGHTYWHPNFKQERKRLTAAEFQKLVDTQLISSRKVIKDKLGVDITILAWPYGIYDDYLEQQAQKDGYVMAFSIDARPADRSENPMSQPRYMIVASQGMKTFADIASGQYREK